MEAINFKRTIEGNLDGLIERVTEALKVKGFGVLTRIDMHAKIKEKLGKDIPETVILGACNPALAEQAYRMNSDVTSLLPCNAVIRAIAPGRFSVEFVKPTAMMKVLGDSALIDLANGADKLLEEAIRNV